MATMTTLPDRIEGTGAEEVVDQLAPAVGLLTGVALGVPLWLALGGLVLLARTQLDPMVVLVRAWAAVFVG
jgi:hypothetical protein